MSTQPQVRPPRPGATIGRYLLQEELRHSDLGACFRAVLPTGESAFLRWAPLPDLQSVQTGAAYEYQSLCANLSEGVPAPVDLVWGFGYQCSVTEWIAAPPLSLQLDGDVERTIVRIAQVLLRSHRAGWVHGDIKPSNLLMCPDRGPMVIDWETARRVGSESVPGTLGYAPARAWTNEYYVASPANDAYALAVLSWELTNRRRLFTGDRCTTSAEQKSFCFPINSDDPPIVQRLYSAANSGGSLEELAPALFSGRGLGLSKRGLARHASVHLLRKAVPQLSSAITSLRPGDSLTLDVPPAVAMDEALDAVASEVRQSLGRSAFVLRDAPNQSPAPPVTKSEAQSRVDRVRDRRLAEARISIAAAASLRDPVVIAPSVWPEDLAEFITDDPAGTPVNRTSLPSLVRLRHTPDHAWPLVERRDLVDALLSRCFATSVIDGSVVEATGLLTATTTSGLARQLFELTESGVVFSDGLMVRASERAANWTLERAASACPAVTVPPIGEWETALDSLLALGESAAASGAWTTALHTCISVNTVLIHCAEPHLELRARLSDLWVECGRGDAAATLLEEAPVVTTTPPLHVALRIARVRASRGEFDRVSSLLARLDLSGADGNERVEVLRLAAIVALAAGDARRSLRDLKSALRLRDAASPATLLWLMNTAGNILRLLGRGHTARRYLRLAQRLSNSVGSVRGRIATLGNLLLVAESTMTPAQAASESNRIAATCLRWGLDIDAAIHGMGSAVRWLRDSSPSHAVALLDTLRTNARIRVTLPAGLRLMMSEMWIAGVDAAGDWDRLLSILAESEPHSTGTDLWLHLNLLRTEIGIYSLSELLCIVRTSRSRPCRALSIVASVPRRGGGHRRRTQVACTALAQHLDTASPLLAHACRVMVQSCGDGQAVSDLIAAMQGAGALGEASLSMSLTTWAFALTHTAVLPAVADRPAGASGQLLDVSNVLGVRRWEALTAGARHTALVSGEGPEEGTVDRCLSALEAHARLFPPPVRGSYLARVSLSGFRALASLPLEPAAAGLDESPSPEWRIDALRAQLHRLRARSDVTNARAIGLERILRCALSLRSSMDVEQLLTGIVSGVMSVCRAERAVVIYELESGSVRSKVCSGTQVVDIGLAAAEISSGILERVRKSGRACLFDDACGDEGVGGRPSVLMYKPRSLIVAPIQVEGSFRGYLYVENRSAARSFGASELELAEGFAAQASLALENAQLVTRLRSSCRDLEAARVDAVRSESLRVLGRMASEVAHDFNNLLTTILGETQLLQQDDVAAGHRDSLSVIERAALDGAAVIRRIQDSTRIRSDRDFELVEMTQLVADVVSSLKQRMSHADCRVSQHSSESAYVRGVATELREALTNMVVNSLDAMPKGGLLRLSCVRRDGHAQIEIEDNGCGMAPETTSRMFDPFFSTKGSKGNGLGLSIAYGVVRRHGGEIGVSSAEGRGTRMVVSIPLVPGDLVVPPSSGHKSRKDGDLEAVGIRHILIIDDEPAVGRVLSQMLERLGLTSEVLTNPREAIHLLVRDGERFDVIMTDFHMPEASGIEVARAAAEVSDAARVILMSGSLNRGATELEQAPVGRILQKPFTLDDVYRALREI